MLRPSVEWVRADLASGVGVWEAVAGVDAVIHAASDSRNAEDVDVQGTRRLVDAARARGVRHVVFISIVGIDQMPSGLRTTRKSWPPSRL